MVRHGQRTRYDEIIGNNRYFDYGLVVNKYRFSLTKRTVIYLELDKEYFTKTSGEPEVLPEYRIGEIVFNNDEFYEALNIVLEKGNRYEKEQEKVLVKMQGNVDGKSSARVVNVIEEAIK